MGYKEVLKGLNPLNSYQKIKVANSDEQKSINPVLFDPAFSFADYLGGMGYGDLLAAESIRLYKKCTPLFNSINMRGEAFSSIPLRVYDKKNKKFIDNHPILELLDKPNAMQSGMSFRKWFAMFYDICGESFVIATGSKGSEPLELLLASPVNITTRPSTEWNTMGFAGSYFLSTVNGTMNYALEERPEGFRYWNAAENQEIWHAKEFNPSQSANNLRGLSKCSPLWLQIQQFIESDQNNYSILKRGGRPSLAWIWDHNEPMSDNQYQRWKEQVKAYEGAVNAGRQVILDKMKLENIGMNNKDMEFSVNRKTVRSDIFSTYAIPLPLVSSEQMTMDNLKTSMLLFYDLSVLPFADDLLDELTRFLMPRYKGSENMKLAYNTNDIAPLRARAIEQAGNLGKLYVLEDNEIRTAVGYEEITGGDQVFKPSNMAPYEADLSAGLDDSNNPDVPLEQNTPRKRYTEELRRVKSVANGKRIFSDEAIEQMADDMGLK